MGSHVSLSHGAEQNGLRDGHPNDLIRSSSISID